MDNSAKPEFTPKTYLNNPFKVQFSVNLKTTQPERPNL